MEKNILKIIISCFLVGTLFVAFVFLVKENFNQVSQQEQKSSLVASSYVPITSDFNENITNTGGSGVMGALNLIFVWGIRIAIALAVIFVVVGAVQYMTTDAMGDKKDGKQRITAAIGGLILALISWLILYTINPDILNSNFLSRLGGL